VSLTNEIRRLSMHAAGTPGSTPSGGSYIPDTPGSKTSTGHDSSKSLPPMPPIPTPYRPDSNTPSETPDADRRHQRHPSPPPRSSQSLHQPYSSQSYPSPIRPPPAVARVAGKEKKKISISSTGYFPPPTNNTPTSHPTTPPRESQSKSGIMSWGKKDTRSSERWESGVIGRERARVITGPVNSKRCYPT
jgi:hypothetical protein